MTNVREVHIGCSLLRQGFTLVFEKVSACSANVVGMSGALVMAALCGDPLNALPSESDRRHLEESVDGSFLVCVMVLWALLLLGWSVSSAKLDLRRQWRCRSVSPDVLSSRKQCGRTDCCPERERQSGERAQGSVSMIAGCGDVSS